MKLVAGKCQRIREIKRGPTCRSGWAVMLTPVETAPGAGTVIKVGMHLQNKEANMFVVPEIPQLDMDAIHAARHGQNQLTKPTGSLGQLEDLAVQIAGISCNAHPAVARKCVIVMAGDHGIVRE